MRDEESSPLVRLYSAKNTLFGAFFSRRPLWIPYYRATIVVVEGAVILKSGCSTIASFDGQILSIGGHLMGDDCTDLFDAILRDGCEKFNGEKGIRAAEMLDARWARSWYTLAYHGTTACCTIPYPFMLDLLNLKLHLPRGFFTCFVQPVGGVLHENQQPSCFKILLKLHDMIALPDDCRDDVLRKIMEMQLDAAT